MLKKEKEIPFKNYIILAGVLVVTAVILILFYKSSRNYKEDNINNYFLNNYLYAINYNEIDDYLIENNDAIIYVSNSNDDRVNNFEIKFKKLITKYNLNNDILYLNIIKEFKDNNLNYEIKKEYGNSYPLILVYRDGTLNYTYNIKNNNYDIVSLEEFLIKEGIVND